jgi:hypothetical protein
MMTMSGMTREEAKRYWEVFLIEIEELKQTYSDIDWEEQEQATKIAITDMEKQIPKKPLDVVTDDNEFICMICPSCEQIAVEFSDKYCRRCGQAIDWSVEND